jgi:hypothetical protein
MADDINKKITIDVEVTTDGQQQINQYKASFDGLRSSIDNLGKPLSDLSKNINNLDNNLSKISGSGSKLSSKVGEFASSFSVWSKVLEVCTGTFEGLEAAVSGGLSILITFAPEMIKWVGNLFKANTTTKSLNQTLNEHKLVIQAVNQARVQGDQNAQLELLNLKLLYNASQDQKLSMTERKKAVKDLQAEYPNYLGNISSEAILAGKATKEYKNLTQAILASSRAKAAQEMIVKNSERQLGDEATVADLKERRDAKQAELNETIKSFREQMAKSDRGRGGWNDEEYDKIQQLRDELVGLQKKTYDAENDSRILDKQNTALTKAVTDNIEKQGAQVITGLNTAIGTGKQTLKTLTQATRKQKDIVTPSLANNAPPADPSLDPDDQAELSAPILSDAQKTSDALKR